MIATDIPTAARRPGVWRGALHEATDQAAMFAPVVKATFRVRAAAEAGAVRAPRRRATALAAPSRPVYVEIPTDLLAAEPRTRRPQRLLPTPTPPARSAPRSPERSRAPDRRGRPARRRGVRARLPAAQRPLIWAGGGAVQAGAGPALAALAERLAAPVITTYSARGLLPPGHPCLVDGPPHVPSRRRGLGRGRRRARDRQRLRRHDDPRLEAAAAADADRPQRRPRRRREELPARPLDRGDAAAGAAALLAAVARAARPRRARATARRAARRSTRRDRAHRPRRGRVPLALERTLPADATVVCDMCIPGYWIGGFLTVAGPRRLAYPLGWGTLGCGFPQGLGAALAGTGPVVSISGDGGFLYAPGELAAAAQERIPLTAVIVDDGGYGMLRFDQEIHGDPHEGVDLATPDFVALAGAFGVRAESVEGLGRDFAAALQRHLALDEPSVLVAARRARPRRPNTSPRLVPRAARAARMSTPGRDRLPPPASGSPAATSCFEQAAEASRAGLRTRRDRLIVTARPILQATVAAALAWLVAQKVVGHGQPFFAPVSAVITLGLTVGEQRSRAVEIAAGVAVGIAIADALVALIGTGTWQIGVVVGLAMLGATLVGGGTLLASQAAVSAVLVATLQPPDAAASTSPASTTRSSAARVALIVSSIVFPIDPVRLVREAATPMLDAFAGALERIAVALETRAARGRRRGAPRGRAASTPRTTSSSTPSTPPARPPASRRAAAAAWPAGSSATRSPPASSAARSTTSAPSPAARSGRSTSATRSPTTRSRRCASSAAAARGSSATSTAATRSRRAARRSARPRLANRCSRRPATFRGPHRRPDPARRRRPAARDRHGPRRRAGRDPHRDRTDAGLTPRSLQRRPRPPTAAVPVEPVARVAGQLGDVHLRLLQLAGVVPVQRLPARELVEHPDARLARAVAGLAVAAERQVRLGAGGGVVDRHHPGAHALAEAERAARVVRVDRRREPVAVAVGERRSPRRSRRSSRRPRSGRTSRSRRSRRRGVTPSTIVGWQNRPAVGVADEAGARVGGGDAPGAGRAGDGVVVAHQARASPRSAPGSARGSSARRARRRTGRRPRPPRPRRVKRRMNSSWTDSWTITVPSDVQRCPAVPKPENSAPSTARSSSASGITTSGFLPPSSRQGDCRWRPHSSPIFEPTADEPVKPTLSTSRSSSARSSPANADGPSHWTRFSTPSGRPPWMNSCASASPSAGAYSAGFHTTALPHSSAGTMYQDGTATGKLPAVMIAATPTGLRNVNSCLSGSSLGTVWP